MGCNHHRFRQSLSTVSILKLFTGFWEKKRQRSRHFISEGGRRKREEEKKREKESRSCVRCLMSLESTTGTDVMAPEKLISLRVNEGGRFFDSSPPNLHSQFPFQKKAILLISMKLGVCTGGGRKEGWGGGDSDSWDTPISPTGSRVGGHRTGEITVQLIGVLTSFHRLYFIIFQIKQHRTQTFKHTDPW